MTVTIQRLGLHGDGIAPGPIYVARALPGEEIAGAVTGDRISAPKIVTPSDQRVKAPCPHYSRCGGCALQHARDDFVADWKLDVVRQALAAHDLDPPMRPIITVPAQTRRRATFSGRRLKKGALVGFHTRASDTLVPVPDCEVLHPDLRAALPMLEALTLLVGSRKAELSFTVTCTDAGLDVDMALDRDLDAAAVAALADLARQHDLARLGQNGDAILTRRPPMVRFDGIGVVPPPGAFLQATVEGEQALRAAVTEAVGSAKHITDLFAGSGTFALPLARSAEVHAVEGDAAMTGALHMGWRQAQGLKMVTVAARDLFRRPLLPDELTKTGAVVIDPPRAGADAQTQELAKAQVARIAYVSCNPVTFARDAKTLRQAGYRLNWVQVVDQFRWSPHIELAASLTAPHIAA